MSNCNECQYKRKSNKQPEPVPGHAVEVMATAFEATVRKLWTVIIILSVLLTAAIVYVIVLKTEYQAVQTTYTVKAEQDADNGGNYAGIGDYYYGEAESQDH